MSCIGVFDSGVGGLSIWREIRQLLPSANTVYFADQAHIPYGPRPLDEIATFSQAIVRFLLAHDCQLIVIACNTISAAALRGLRQQFPAVPFVGMEPAIKPAAAHTRTRTIGVLATSATFQGELFASVVERFANNVTLINQVGWGLVEQVEQGRLDTPDTIVLLEKCLKPILAAGADSIVLGCTHYPFLLPAIQRLVGPTLEVIDPAPAVARRVKQLAEQYATLLTTHAGQHVFYTTGGTQNFSELLNCLAGVKNGDIRAAQWRGNEIVE